MTDPFPQFLLTLLLTLGGACLLGGLARRLGQSAVLGELLAGILLGPSVLGRAGSLAWTHLDPRNETFSLLSQLGVLILLFEIGLETDLVKLLRVARECIAVTLVGVVGSFVLGFAACRFLGYNGLVSTVAGATLTATSVGITARVLAEMGRLQDVESRIILGAAILDDVLGLVILAIISGRITSEEVSLAGMVRISALAFGFLAAALLGGWLLLPLIGRLVGLLEATGKAPLMALLFALALAWVANAVQPGLAIVGGVAAGLLLARVPQVRTLQEGLAQVGHFFVPIFFVVTGAGVDVRLLNPLDAANRPVLGLAGLLLVAAVAGKVAAGYAPVWFHGNKSVIGAGMIPRGEVSLIVANTGQSVLGGALFSALTLLIMVTTFLVPPLLKLLLATPRTAAPVPVPGSVEDLTTEP